MLKFVSTGGGLIFTEWYAYNIYDKDLEEPIANLMPVISDDGDYDSIAKWNVANGYENHPLITNLLSTVFTEVNDGEDTYSLVLARAGTTVVMDDGGGVPLLSYANLHGGPVIHINDGMAYEGKEISDEMLSVINSSVLFAANGTVAVTEPPALGIFALALLAFVSRKYQSMGTKKRKRPEGRRTTVSFLRLAANDV